MLGTDGTTRGLREFKLQIFIVLQMGDIQKEPSRDNNNKIETREKILLGIQRRGKNKNHLCCFLIYWLSWNSLSLILHLITGFNNSPECFTDIKVRKRWAVLSNMSASGSISTHSIVWQRCEAGHSFSMPDQINLQTKHTLAKCQDIYIYIYLKLMKC